MQILLVSGNPLFAEAILQLFKRSPEFVIEKISQEMFFAAFDKSIPDVMLIDLAVEKVNLEKILEAGRNLPQSKILLLSQERNDVVVVRSQRVIIERAEDLMKNLSLT
jgi:DNA-binding NarL/FixJ family response regulator